MPLGWEVAARAPGGYISAWRNRRSVVSWNSIAVTPPRRSVAETRMRSMQALYDGLGIDGVRGLAAQAEQDGAVGAVADCR